MTLIVRSPEKEILNQESVSFIHMTLSDGYPISVFPDHAPLIASFSEGIIEYEVGESIHRIAASDGLIKVEDNRVNLFVDWLNTIDEGLPTGQEQ